MKKAQTSEYLGIIILVIVIAVFAMFGRIGRSSVAVEGSLESLREYQSNRFLLITKIFPHITIKNVPIEQLIGVYVCYDNETINYGTGDINLSKELSFVLDNSVGKHEWLLQIGESTCIDSGSLQHTKCHLPPTRDIMSHEFVFSLPCDLDFERATLFVMKK